MLRALQEQGVDPKGKDVVILGAGGASRAISYVLARRGARLTILNRKQELDWARNIARLIKDSLGAEAKVLELARPQLKAALDGAAILVNATSVGMAPDPAKSLVPAEFLVENLVVADVIYSPLKTRLLRDAADAGCQTVSGVEMLVWQGVLCFELWTGEKAPVDIMRRAALAKLERHED